jgi:hypothetical protein
MKKILFLALLFTSQFAISAESMRHCMLLPVTDGADNKIGFKIFEDIESYLKDSEWCTYKSNSELINILGQYSKNLEIHLNNKDVLKVISDKTKAGTLIKVNLVLGPNLTDVGLEVIGENGEDRYFKEQTQIRSTDTLVMSQTIKNWLDVYEKTIPYNGRIKGVLGDQFTIDIGKKSQLYNGSTITIERPVSKRQHPLLKEIVDYQTEKIAEAKVFNVDEMQAQAKVTSYEGNKKLKIEDWVKVRSIETRKAVEQVNYGEKEDTEFGKLGTIGIFLNLGNSGVSQTTTSERTMDGFLFGGDLAIELWATRNWWGGLDFGKRFGDYKTDQGTFSNDTYSTDNTQFRLKFGYKYLPLGFFYGPQVDVYGGYGSYSYGLSTNTVDKFTEFTFSGLLLGAKGSLPVFESTRAYLLIDFILSPGYSEKVTTFGSDESASNYRLEGGMQYTYEPNITLQGGVELISNKASFTGTTKEQQFKDVSAKVGAIFTF